MASRTDGHIFPDTLNKQISAVEESLRNIFVMKESLGCGDIQTMTRGPSVTITCTAPAMLLAVDARDSIMDPTRFFFFFSCC